MTFVVEGEPMTNSLEENERTTPVDEEHDLLQLTVPLVANTENVPENVRAAIQALLDNTGSLEVRVFDPEMQRSLMATGQGKTAASLQSSEGHVKFWIKRTLSFPLDPSTRTYSEAGLMDEELEVSAALEAIHDGMQRLLDTMSVNIALLEDSVREVRTARQIAAESNRMARRRLLREGSLALGVATK